MYDFLGNKFNWIMTIEEARKQEFIGRVMYTSLFSINEKIRIIEKLKNDDLSEDNFNQILDVVQHFDNGSSSAINRYYRNMDTVYNEYLNKNISQLKQNMWRITLEVSEAKTKESEWNPDLLLNQID